MVQRSVMPYSAPALAMAVTLPVPKLNPSRNIPGKNNAKALANLFLGLASTLISISYALDKALMTPRPSASPFIRPMVE